ncbi:MAG: D-alanyl-D-alanine carboxypeptidase/D-alanyl-D-alanine-endopeptidase [Ignavibacteriales bacterium]|nr:D-alanyl-D-alanine carboxypeptidase/D-alanyl-D-alanine-endopeptidase [Ignavibacteriales bacterium]
MKKILFTLIVLVYFTQISADPKENIKRILAELPSSTKTSLYILDATTGESVYESNINEPMIPASNTKLFTTSAALYLMGPNYIFSTNILTDDFEIQNGIVDGNLYIKGFGNSTFKSEDIDTLISILVENGIKQINGDIIADDSYFDNLYTRDDWIIDENANVKLPPVSALVINKNQFVISLYSTGKVGSKLKYAIKPECSFINVNIDANVTEYRSRPRITSTFNNNEINVKVTGGLRKRRTPVGYVVNIDNPPLYFSLLLKEKLLNNGIKVLGNSEIGKTPSPSNDLASVGIDLDSLIALINKNSNNYLAECLFKSVGAFYSGEEGNSFYATQAVLTTFSDEYIIDDETAVVDGSGISRFNTITTGSIVRLLQKIYNDRIYYEDFYRSLAISGIDGTLKDRDINNFIKGNFHGKTGTLNGVTALAGYLTGRDNHLYIISTIMQYKSRGSSYHKNIEDKILLELTK